MELIGFIFIWGVSRYLQVDCVHCLRGTAKKVPSQPCYCIKYETLFILKKRPLISTSCSLGSDDIISKIGYYHRHSG